MTEALFTIYSTIDNWPHRDQRYTAVEVTWYIEREEPPIPYSKAIVGYEPGMRRTRNEGFIDGLFTKEEADLLGKYLKEHHNTEIRLEEIQLPVSSNIVGMFLCVHFCTYFHVNNFLSPFWVRVKF